MRNVVGTLHLKKQEYNVYLNVSIIFKHVSVSFVHLLSSERVRTYRDLEETCPSVVGSLCPTLRLVVSGYCVNYPYVSLLVFPASLIETPLVPSEGLPPP